MVTAMILAFGDRRRCFVPPGGWICPILSITSALGPLDMGGTIHRGEGRLPPEVDLINPGHLIYNRLVVFVHVPQLDFPGVSLLIPHVHVDSHKRRPSYS
jgi:hypothetical protein